MKKQIIYECEFFAFFCAFWLWAERLSGAAVIHTDNNSVRDAMIACSAAGEVPRRILLAVLALETSHQLIPWYARVPTDSNYADGPSRLETEVIKSLGAVECNFDFDECWGSMRALAESWGEDQAHTLPK